MSTKIYFEKIITDLGGEISQENCFDSQCTHLLCEKPSRTEKYLACLAAGKWVLHKNYINMCKEKDKFVDPELFEWGCPTAIDNLPKVENNQQSLARAAHRCRKTTNDQKIRYKESQNNNCLGAFSEWHVVLLVDKKKEAGFTRLLAAGGATINSYNAKKLKGITHAFLNDNTIEKIDLPLLLSFKILTLKPEYIITALLEEKSNLSHNSFIFVPK